VSNGVPATPADAVEAYQRGMISLADVLCHILRETGSREPVVLAISGMIALHVQEYRKAVEYLTEAHRLMPGEQGVKQGLDAARKGAREQAMRRPDLRKRYLVIKAWGYGFCSDLDHVLGALLLAEITGRTPLVHWGKGSLFRDEPEENAWPRFFEPVSSIKLSDLLGKKFAFFPPKWNEQNILEAEVNKFDGEWARMGPQLYLNVREEIAVSDLHVGIAHVLSWCRPGTPHHGRSISQVYRAIAKKYLRPSKEVVERIESFAGEHFAGAKVIGVHVRGGDKPVEDPVLLERNLETPAIVDTLLAQHPGAKVFLLTDDAKVREQYAQRYGTKLVATDCLRTKSAHGLHYIEHESRTRLGIEVMVDMYLAARCDFFIGVGTSNVSAMIEHLKDWPEGALDLRPYSIHYTLNPFLYRFELPPDQEAAFRQSVEAQKAREQQGA
jgi:protein O-GlcNAc transferase